MKIQCSCGAKFAFDITPEMAKSGVQFVCPECGVDGSEVATKLVWQELAKARSATGLLPPQPTAPPPPVPAASSSPLVARVVQRPAAPAPVRGQHTSSPALTSVTPATERVPLSGPASDAPPPLRISVPPSAAPGLSAGDASAAGQSEELPPCAKHPGQVAAEKCVVCSKPICPKCMELFGYVCSPLCKAKAEAKRIDVPVYAGKKSLVEARLWRKTGWIAATACLVLLGAAGFWFWYAWFGSVPRPVFSVRFDERAYSGQSALCGPDQIVFLHGDTLARHDMKQKKAIWSRQLVDTNQIEAAVTREIKEFQAMIDKANFEGRELVPKMPSREKLVREAKRAAAAALQLRVHASNIWVESPEKLTRYDLDSGNLVKQIPLPSGLARTFSHGDELVCLVDDSGRDEVTCINLSTCETRTEDLAPPKQPAPTAAGKAAGPKAGGPAGRGTEMAGLPVGMPGKDAGKPLDPAKVAEQAQHLSYPAKVALPAVLAGNMSQERALAELNDQAGGPAKPPGKPSAAEENFVLIPDKGGFVQFSTRLVEERITHRSAMKAPLSKSALDGAVTASKTTEVANEILNEMQRSRGGDVVEEDESRYQVTFRRPDGKDAWSGEVIGPPSFFPLTSVNVLAANKMILVFDKANKKLWQSSLNYNVPGGEGATEPEDSRLGQGPCVERKGTLYVADEGVLTAFDLPTGGVLWRLPSVGIAGMFFDDQDMLYVNSTTASPEKLKYSRQIDISQKTGSIILKADAKSGKLLWTASPGGLLSYVSGPFVYTVQAYQPDDEQDENPYKQETGFETPPYLRIKRINPKNGRQMWEHFQQRAPVDVEFDRNSIRLVFRKEVQVLRFLAM